MRGSVVRWLVALLVALGAAAGLACEGERGEPTTLADPLTQLGSVSFADKGTQDVAGMAEVRLTAEKYAFAPTFLSGRPGQRLRVVVENQSENTAHNLSVAGQPVNLFIPGSGTGTVEVTFPSSGAALFFCSFHTFLGMNGELLAGTASPQPVSR